MSVSDEAADDLLFSVALKGYIPEEGIRIEKMKTGLKVVYVYSLFARYHGRKKAMKYYKEN
jgi:hypothetical protein